MRKRENYTPTTMTKNAKTSTCPTTYALESDRSSARVAYSKFATLLPNCNNAAMRKRENEKSLKRKNTKARKLSAKMRQTYKAAATPLPSCTRGRRGPILNRAPTMLGQESCCDVPCGHTHKCLILENATVTPDASVIPFLLRK
jgi:hypothetical protein